MPSIRSPLVWLATALALAGAGCCFNDERARAFQACSGAEPCPPGLRCEQGVCVTEVDGSIEAPPDVPPDTTDGGCAACDPIFGSCTGGVCSCSGGMTPCGPTARCTDRERDPSHCGACGVACADTQHCVAGACECRPGLLVCTGECVDVTANANHCGRCGNRCGGGTPQCYESACSGTLCPAQMPPADACDPGGSSCIARSTLRDDPLNCGSCNRLCARTQVCCNFLCQSFTIGRSCTTCPCSDCAAGDSCCIEPGTTNSVICLAAGARCP